MEKNQFTIIMIMKIFFSSTLSPITENKNIEKKNNFKNLQYYFNYGFFPDGFFSL